MGKAEVEAFLSHLAVEGNVSASTRNQDLSALLFLYKHVLKQELDDRVDAIRAKRPTYLPTVLTPDMCDRSSPICPAFIDFSSKSFTIAVSDKPNVYSSASKT